MQKLLLAGGIRVCAWCLKSCATGEAATELGGERFKSRFSYRFRCSGLRDPSEVGSSSEDELLMDLRLVPDTLAAVKLR